MSSAEELHYWLSQLLKQYFGAHILIVLLTVFDLHYTLRKIVLILMTTMMVKCKHEHKY